MEIPKNLKGLVNFVSDGQLDSYVLLRHNQGLELEYSKFELERPEAKAGPPKVKAPGKK